MDVAERRLRIVAEIGSGHRRSKDRARTLIRAAIDSGADIIKFQHFYADEIVHPRTGEVDLPGGRVKLFERFRELELSVDFLSWLKSCCENAGGRFFCSPFGMRSARDLLDIGESAFKIASPELNHLPLLRFLSPHARELVLSTGISQLSDIDEALTCLHPPPNPPTGAPDGAPPRITLLHCVTSYPAPESEYNLRLIPNLANIFNLPVGISDHSLDPILIPTLAVLLGAVMVEKHFTLNQNDGGLDDSIALTPQHFANMSASLRIAETLQPAPDPIAPDLIARAHQHPHLQKYPPAQLLRALGNGTKTLAPAEQANYGRSNRSIHILADRPAGHILTAADIAILRSEKNLRPGLHPRHFEQIVGCTLSRPLQGGDGLSWDDLLHRSPTP